MSLNNKKIRKTIYRVLILAVLTFNYFVINQQLTLYSTNNSINSLNGENNGAPKTSDSTSYSNLDWLDNTDFTSGIDPWYSQVTGDSSDLLADYSVGAANIIVDGDNGSIVIDDINTPDWVETKNPDRQIQPDYADIDDYGFYTYHEWNEFDNQTRNYVSVWWRRNVEMGKDMLDYNITSVLLNVEFNASVTAIRTSGGDTDDQGAIDRPTDNNLDEVGQGDYAEFYVMIQDVYQQNPATMIAKNNTKESNLGLDSVPVNTIDGSMEVFSDSTIEGALTSAFEESPNNFSIIVGIDMYCEDNEEGVDIDDWEDLYIDYFNFSFSYEKLIDQDTSLSWNQKGDMINHTGEAYYSYTRIDAARLNFNYKINTTWTSESYNSEINFLINNISQTEYPPIKLGTYNFTDLNGAYKEARSGGYDITRYIPVEDNISLTIVVTMINTFDTGKNFNISISDVTFTISYTVFTNPPLAATPSDGGSGKSKTKTTIIEEPWFNLLIAIGAIAGGACLAGYLVAYQLVLKYPKPVRKVRKYRKGLKKKQAPDLEILGRGPAFKELYNEHSAASLLKIKGPKKLPASEKPALPSPKKLFNDSK